MGTESERIAVTLFKEIQSDFSNFIECYDRKDKYDLDDIRCMLMNISYRLFNYLGLCEYSHEREEGKPGIVHRLISEDRDRILAEYFDPDSCYIDIHEMDEFCSKNKPETRILKDKSGTFYAVDAWLKEDGTYHIETPDRFFDDSEQLLAKHTELLEAHSKPFLIEKDDEVFVEMVATM